MNIWLDSSEFVEIWPILTWEIWRDFGNLPPDGIRSNSDRLSVGRMRSKSNCVNRNSYEQKGKEESSSAVRERERWSERRGGGRDRVREWEEGERGRGTPCWSESHCAKFQSPPTDWCFTYSILTVLTPCTLIEFDQSRTEWSEWRRVFIPKTKMYRLLYLKYFFWKKMIISFWCCRSGGYYVVMNCY